MNQCECKIISEPSVENPFLILDKPSGLPSAPLFGGEKSALTWAIEKFPQIKLVHGKKPIEYGLLHRLDTATSGLLLIASSQESYDFFAMAQKKDEIIKYYKAGVDFSLYSDCSKSLEDEGFPPDSKIMKDLRQKVFDFSKDSLKLTFDLTLQSRFRPYGSNSSQVRPVTEESGRAAQKKSGEKLYKTKVVLHKPNYAICSISQGYRHQVRCHLAWLGLPVLGDFCYNKKYKEGENLDFRAIQIEFPHPVDGRIVKISC